MARIPVHIKALLSELEAAAINYTTCNMGRWGDSDDLDDLWYEYDNARERVETAIERYIKQARREAAKQATKKPR